MLAVVPGHRNVVFWLLVKGLAYWRHTSFPVLSFLPLLSPFGFFPECTAQGSELWLRSWRPRTQIYLSDRLGTAAMWTGVLDPEQTPGPGPALHLE